MNGLKYIFANFFLQESVKTSYLLSSKNKKENTASDLLIFANLSWSGQRLWINLAAF